MTWLDPKLRPKRKSWAKWATVQVIDNAVPCAHCGLDLCSFAFRYLRLVLVSKRVQESDRPGDATMLLFPLWLCHRWLRGIGFNAGATLYQADHIVPIWNGGPDTERNMQVLCRPCHNVKTRDEAAQRRRAPKKRFA